MIQSSTSISTQSDYSLGDRLRFGSQSSNKAVRSGATPSSSVSQLTPEQQQQVQQLKEVDRKVRAHEQAHLAVGADLVRGGATFSYQTGPDNKRYAVAGEVSIDTSPGRTPEETIPKAQHIYAAALAPADPSAQDHSVAAQASRMESDARIELTIQQRDAAAKTNSAQSNTRLYQSVAQSGASSASVGFALDLFA